MSKINTKESTTIASVIEGVQSGSVNIDDLCVYAEEDVDDITLELICYLDEYPTVSGDVEVFSDFVVSNNLELVYYGQQFKDVVINVLSQKKSASLQEVLSALNYYLENDDFLEVN